MTTGVTPSSTAAAAKLPLVGGADKRRDFLESIHSVPKVSNQCTDLDIIKAIASAIHFLARIDPLIGVAMARMTAIDAAVLVLEKEGITCAFGIPGAAINPLYAAMKRRGSIAHVLARHVEGASHMAEGYTRAMAGNIGVCIGTSGPAGTDMITGLYSAQADSIPILCITGQAPRARLYKEDFQAVDIESIAEAGHQVVGHRARAGAGARARSSRRST